MRDAACLLSQPPAIWCARRPRRSQPRPERRRWRWSCSPARLEAAAGGTVHDIAGPPAVVKELAWYRRPGALVGAAAAVVVMAFAIPLALDAGSSTSKSPSSPLADSNGLRKSAQKAFASPAHGSGSAEPNAAGALGSFPVVGAGRARPWVGELTRTTAIGCCRIGFAGIGLCKIAGCIRIEFNRGGRLLRPGHPQRVARWCLRSSGDCNRRIPRHRGPRHGVLADPECSGRGCATF